MGEPVDKIDDGASDDASSSPSPELRRGTRLGRYELLVPIAKGGMARVWAARQHGMRGFSKIVAIKTILPHLAREPEFERMFLDEARIAALVHHPNVCEIYELGDEGGTLYLAMEWVPGDSLVHVLRGGASGAGVKAEPIDMRVAARIVADAASGLHAAHELTDDDGQPLGVVHRDVSPHNVLVTGDGHVKVADFGVAKALGQMHSATVAGQIKGKLSYMAPEQVTGSSVDRRSDVFALGCVLYECCTGVTPFRGDGDPQIMHALLKGEYTAPTKLVPAMPKELEAIIVRALSGSPASRYQDADQMKAALEEWLAASGPIVTASHVGALVRQRIGHVLDRRRDRIRAASSATPAQDASASGVLAPGAVPSSAGGLPSAGFTPPPGQVAAGSGSGVVPSGAFQATPPPGRAAYAAMATTMSSRQGVALEPSGAGKRSLAEITGLDPMTLRYVMAAAIGVAVALVIGIGGIVAWRAAHKPAIEEDVTAAAGATAAATSTPTPTTTTTTTTTTTPTSTTGSPTASSAGALGVQGAAQAAALPPVVVKTTPDDAALLVDGTPSQAHEIARPPAGTTVNVVVRADGYVDQTIKIESGTTSPIEVKLAKEATHEHHHGSGSGGKSGGGSPALPANPY